MVRGRYVDFLPKWSVPLRRCCYVLPVLIMLAGAIFALRGSVAENTLSNASLQAVLDHPDMDLPDADLGDLRRFYAMRNYAPAWFGDDDRSRDAATALKILGYADADGLDPAAYRIEAIRLRRQGGSQNAMAAADILLTSAVLRYMDDLYRGRIIPAQIENDVELPGYGFDPVTTLAGALSTGALAKMVASLAPAHSEYAALRIALTRYRETAHEGGWQTIPAIDAKLAVSDWRFALLWRRLASEDPDMAAAPQSLDGLIAAIKRYQARNGLEETGAIDKKTQKTLNVSLDERIDQISANLERWRWVHAPFGSRYIEVNTADATLKVVDGNKVVLTSRIVAGKISTPTPMFVADAVAVTVNPYWNIPAAIARHEILPKERRHPGYMASQHIVTDDSGGLKQLPGAGNALGFLKLEMPNRFNAYLHDTPARKLFAESDRHFSHGCMRVQQIEPLASWALTGDSAAARDRLDALIASGDNQRISLDRPVPVYVLYWTAIAEQDGTVGFRPDIYGRDRRLLAALAGQSLFGRVSLNTDCQALAAG